MTHEALTGLFLGYIAVLVTYIAFNIMFRR
jgi:hypothetical protein